MVTTAYICNILLICSPTSANTQVYSFKAHLRATALPLIDIHLYLSSENNYHITRPAWTAILPWYANYFIPPTRRTAAKVRTEHLGLSGLDIDHNVSSSQTKPFSTIEERYENAKTASLAGNAMARGRGSGGGYIAPADTAPERTFSAPTHQKGNVRDMLIGSGSTTLFKLDSVADACFGPLEELLGDKRFLISDTAVDSNQPSSLDCLALGYLSLIAFPDTRKAFLADVLRTKYAKLYAYVLRLQEVIFGQQMVNVRAVMSLEDKTLTCKIHQSMASTSHYADNDSLLPWSSLKSRQPAHRTFKSTTIAIIHSIPLLNSMLPHSIDKLTLNSDPSQTHPSISSSSSSPSSYNALKPLSLFSSFLPLTTTIFTFFTSYATYAALSEKADVNPDFRIERGAEWRQRQRQRTFNHEYVHSYSNVGTILDLIKHGIGGLFGDGGRVGSNVISAREEDWGRPNAAGSVINRAIADEKTEASVAEIEADVKVEA